MCVFVTRGVIVQAHPLAVSGSVYPTQHNTTHARTRTHACTHTERERERERGENERVRERAGERERERRTRAHTHTHTHVYTVVVLYATFVGFHNTYAGDFGTFVTPFTVARLVGEKSGSR